jgi:hypothetical protein
MFRTTKQFMFNVIVEVKIAPVIGKLLFILWSKSIVHEQNEKQHD